MFCIFTHDGQNKKDFFPKSCIWRGYTHRVAFYNHYCSGNIRGISYAHADLCLIQRHKTWFAYAKEPVNTVRLSTDWSSRESEPDVVSEKRRKRKKNHVRS